jgi:hypothetical protein
MAVTYSYTEVHTFFQNFSSSPKILGAIKVMTQVWQWGPTNIWRQCNKFSRLGDLVPRTFTPLF